MRVPNPKEIRLMIVPKLLLMPQSAQGAKVHRSQAHHDRSLGNVQVVARRQRVTFGGCEYKHDDEEAILLGTATVCPLPGITTNLNASATRNMPL
ncbi:hypothetical protein IE81DRAFT_206734 [Ceraceosorus guamensis]|uniref:Uncharacterized protein n=1 Tax=Ceraceosorus guamensis TaxID=1522189 RepID=A0A316W5M6_9BASI|nr:hypothetical protein IE81DRAFT_206734 [Ceraceosorus guamensis]PWN45167.1 hypothetical protein IE81DRAFT_206734 [Ceraceosorus guamensis]